MTPEAALYDFLSGFGIPAYAASSVPSGRPFPYITYDLTLTGDWDDGEVMLVANVWYRTDKESLPNGKVREIRDRVGRGGTMLPCDGGMVWLKTGTPWSQSVTIDGADELVKRRRLIFDVEFLTL